MHRFSWKVLLSLVLLCARWRVRDYSGSRCHLSVLEREQLGACLVQMHLGLCMLSVIFHCSPTPDVPASESSICRDDHERTDIICCRLRAIKTFILGFLVGVENFVLLCRLRARVAISIFESRYPSDRVRRKPGSGTVGDLDCVDVEDASDRDPHRQIHTQTYTQTDIQTDRNTHRHTHRQIYRQTETHTDTNTQTHTHTHRHIQAHTGTDTHADTYAHRQTVHAALKRTSILFCNKT